MIALGFRPATIPTSPGNHSIPSRFIIVDHFTHDPFLIIPICWTYIFFFQILSSSFCTGFEGKEQVFTGVSSTLLCKWMMEQEENLGFICRWWRRDVSQDTPDLMHPGKG